MEKDNTVYLKHIRDAVSIIEEYTRGIDKDYFDKTRMLQDAVIREIEIIGEATKRLDQETKNKKQEIPWKKIAGARDMLIHEYEGVDLDTVWGAIKNDLPKLKEAILDLLNC